jgi:hypothetical protein
MGDVKLRYLYRSERHRSLKLGTNCDVPIHSVAQVFKIFSSLRILDLIGSQDSIANGAGHCPFGNERPARCSRLQSESASGLPVSAERPITRRGAASESAFESESSLFFKSKFRFSAGYNQRLGVPVSAAATAHWLSRRGGGHCHAGLRAPARLGRVRAGPLLFD